VGQVSPAIKFRLSKAQMAVIWPGLDFIACAYLTRVRTGTCQYAYPFQIYPLPQGVDTGGFSNKMIDAIIALWRRLQPKAKTGGRAQMDTIDIRAAILSCRVNLQHLQRRAYDRQFLRVSPWAFESCSKEWRWHLRWIRFHLAYFNPLPSIQKSLKRFYQLRIDRLVALAESGIQYLNYLPLEPRKLRRIIRLFVRSARRGRISPFIWQELMKPTPSWQAQLSVLEFVEKRANLQKAAQA
jgi:hypothetical protein